MNELLEFALEAHGGLENWRTVTSVDLKLSLKGYVCDIQQHCALSSCKSGCTEAAGR
jgi:hypothetical protein